MDTEKILYLSLAIFALSLYLAFANKKKEGFQSQQSRYVDSVLGLYLQQTQEAEANHQKYKYLTADCYPNCGPGAIDDLEIDTMMEKAARQRMNQDTAAQGIPFPAGATFQGSYPQKQ
jgi:hypothetical protein